MRLVRSALHVCVQVVTLLALQTGGYKKYYSNSLTAIPCRMHRISFDLRSYAAQGPDSTRVGDCLGTPQGAVSFAPVDVCCLLFVVCCFLFVVSSFLFVVCCLFFVVCSLLFVVLMSVLCSLMFVVCLFVVCSLFLVCCVFRCVFVACFVVRCVRCLGLWCFGLRGALQVSKSAIV